MLLPALELASERDGREAERELAFRWATGWLYASRRVVPPASRPQGVLLFDSSPRLDLESLHVQALELGLRRAGFRTLLLAFDLPPERVVRAIRAIDPTAFVFCGGEATLEVVGRLVYTVRQVGSAAPVFEYREAMPVTGDHGIPSLGGAPIEAVDRLKGYVDSGRIEQVLVVPEADEEPAATRCRWREAPGRVARQPPPLSRRAASRQTRRSRVHPALLQCRRDVARARRSARPSRAAGAAARGVGRAPPAGGGARARGGLRGRLLGARRAHHRRRRRSS